MTTEIKWDLVLSYLEGTCTSRQEAEVRNWLESDPVNRQSFELLLRIWNAPDRLLPAPDVEKALQSVMERAGIPSLHARQSPAANFDTGVDQTAKGKKRILVAGFFRRPPLKVLGFAAMITFLISGAYVVVRSFRLAHVEITVPYGEQRERVLPDGSRVVLDAGSRFRYSRGFGRKNRTGSLSGEGYFEILADEHHPFLLEARKARITVLGTRFNVSAWEKSSVTVAVMEGRVSLRPGRSGSEGAGVVIGEGQMSRSTASGPPSMPEPTDTGSHLSWLRKEKAFHQVPFRQVLDQVERWYNVECVLDDTTCARKNVTVFLQNRPLGEIVELLALVIGSRVSQRDDRIIFFPE